MRWGAKNLNGGEGEIYLGSGEFKSSFGGGVKILVMSLQHIVVV